jgi:hypothetical protein
MVLYAGIFGASVALGFVLMKKFGVGPTAKKK